MPQDVSPLTQAHLDAKNVGWVWFIRILFPSPTGQKRYTDYPQADSYDLDLGNGATDWDGTMPFTVGTLEQSTSGSMSDLSDVTFLNVDRFWTGLRKLHGLSNHPIEIWLVLFLDVMTGGRLVSTPIRKIKMFDGITEGAHCGQTVRFGLLPGIPTYAILFPKRRIDATLFPWLPPPGMTYDYIGADGTSTFSNGGIPATVFGGGPPYIPPADLGEGGGGGGGGGTGRGPVVLPGGRGRPGPIGVGPR